MPCAPAQAPTLAGFTAFLYNVAGFPVGALPGTSPVIEMAFCVALEIVNLQLAYVSPLIYQLAVYNLGTSNVLNYAQDPVPATVKLNDLPYFQALRAQFNCLGFTAGVISSTADESTSESLLTPEFMKGLTLSNLQQLKDPWGRQYLAFAQDMGTLWGVT